MKFYKLISLFIFSLFILLLNISCQKNSTNEDYQIRWRKKLLKDFSLPKNAQEVELKFSFPSEEMLDKNIYFYSARYISSDSLKNIYVSDAKANRVFKFDSAGKYLTQFGQEGQGPGDLLNPRNILITNDFSTMVNDTLNGRFQFFDKNGNYSKSFKIFKIYSDMVISREGLIFGAPLISDTEDHLIDVLAEDGQLLYSFGKPMKFQYDLSQLNEVRLALNNRNRELFVAFCCFAVVRKYSLDGELLSEFRIDHNMMKKREKINQARISSRAKEKKTGYMHTLEALEATNDGFFILHIYPRIEILEFDNIGNLRFTYWNRQFPDYLAEDFIVLNNGTGKLFYILQNRPKNKVDVFYIKNQ